MRRLILAIVALLSVASGASAQSITSIQYPPAVTPTSFTVTWTTSVPASTWLKYGPTTNLDNGTETPHDQTLVTTHVVTISGLAPNTTYHWQINSIAANGIWMASDTDYTATTLVSSPTAPPVISAVAPWSVGSQSALIQWKTDQPSDSQIEYGPTSLYGFSTPLDTAPRTDHSQSIYGLTPLTTYHYRVRSANAFGPQFSSDRSFLTPDLTGCHVTDDPLIILELASIYTGPFHDGDATSGRVIISWLTREPADSQVEWGLTPFVGAPGITQIDPLPVTAHVRSIGPLVDGQVYFYRVRSRVADPRSGSMLVYCATGLAQTILPVPVGVVGPTGPQGLQGPAGPAGTSTAGSDPISGSMLVLPVGTAAPSGYTLVGTTMMPVQTTSGYKIVSICLWRKD